MDKYHQARVGYYWRTKEEHLTQTSKIMADFQGEWQNKPKRWKELNYWRRKREALKRKSVWGK